MKLSTKVLVLFLFTLVLNASISSRKIKLSKKADTRWKLLNEVVVKATQTIPNLSFKNIDEFNVLNSQLELEASEENFKFKVAMKNQDFKNHPTVISGLLLLKNFNLLNDDNILKKASVLSKIESLYLKVPYHNKYHPADMLLRLNRWLSNDNFKVLLNTNKSEAKIILESLVYAVAGHDAYHPGVKNTEVCKPSVQERMKKNIKTAAENICFQISDQNESVKATLEVVHSYLTNSILALEKDNLPIEIVDSSKRAVESISQRSHFFTDLNYVKNSTTQLNKLKELEIIDSCITATDYMVSLNLKNNKNEMTTLQNYNWSNTEDSNFVENLKQFARYLMITLDISNTGSNHVQRSIRFSLSVLSEFSFGANKSYTACEIIEEQKLSFFNEFFADISNLLHLSQEENLLTNLKLNNYYLFKKFENSDENSISECKESLTNYFKGLGFENQPFIEKMNMIPEPKVYIKKMNKDKNFMLSKKFEESDKE